MEISKEQLEQFRVQFEEQQRLSRLNNKLNQGLKKLFQECKIPSLVPQWHTNPADIDFLLQKDKLDERLLSQGFSILESVDIEKLFDNLEDGNPQMFREKQLYHKDMIDTNISKVLNHWLKGEKLIPATITMTDNFLTSTLGCPEVDNPKLFATDGKHRLNVAYFYNCKKIPIIVLTPQLREIKNQLGIQ